MARTKRVNEDPIVERLDKLTNQLEKLIQGQGAPRRAAFRPQEVAEMTGVSLPLIYQEIHSGQLKTLKINNSYLVSQTALSAWLDSESPNK